MCRQTALWQEYPCGSSGCVQFSGAEICQLLHCSVYSAAIKRSYLQEKFVNKSAVYP